MTRRELIGSLVATAAPAAQFRYSICSGAFSGQPLAGMCRSAERTGYRGLELDPSQLSEDPATLTPFQRQLCRDIFVNEGVPYVGLLGFLRVPPGMHLTTPDKTVRERSWEYFDRLLDLAADLGPNPVMTLGHGKQREATGGITPKDAAARIVEGLSKLAPHAKARGVSILMEPLAPHLCNTINTLDEAMDIVRQVNNPAVATILDIHNTAGEKEPLDELIRRHFAFIRHVHINEMDGRYPGSGKFPFGTVLKTLAELRYSGWVSVELFDFEPDGDTVARKSIEYLRSVEPKTGTH